MTVVHERELELTQEQIDRWADLSGDRNPLHVDAAFAAATPFGGTIAHGHIALSCLEELLLELEGDAWLRGGELTDVRFRSPVRPGRRHRIVARAQEDVWALEVRDPDETLCVEGIARLAGTIRGEGSP